MTGTALNTSTLQPFNALTIKNNVLGRRIKHRTAADGFAERFAEMAQARVADFCGGFSAVIAPSPQYPACAFHPQVAQKLRNSQTDFPGKNPPRIKRPEANSLPDHSQRGRFSRTPRE